MAGAVQRREIRIARTDLDAYLTSANAASSPAASRAYESLLDAIHASTDIAVVISDGTPAEGEAR